ncbi:MAG: PIN domain-containing protein [Planctomycetes bacterium]|nr:PIN domain-containing protein [Planctomycetota bacterium]
MKYALDTNVVIAALTGVPAVTDRRAAVAPEDVGIPVVVLAELLYGAYRSSCRGDNLGRIVALRQRVAVLPLTEQVAERYGATRAALQLRGVPKSDFDLIIACTALESGLTLVSNDGGPLDGVIDGLRVENWLQGGSA